MKEDDKTYGKKISEKQMIGGCCVCADDSGYCDNPLVYCDGVGCNVAVHQACYGIVTVPEGPWFCRRCEIADKNIQISCSLCPSKEGAMKRTDAGGWAHVICALYIPEITFTNVRTMEPIVTVNIRNERFNKKCYICETNKSKYSDNGVCVNCSKSGCKLWFHVTCAQTNGLLCEDHSLPGNNVKYCIYCKNHHSKLNSEHIKIVPPFKMIQNNTSSSFSTKHIHDDGDMLNDQNSNLSNHSHQSDGSSDGHHSSTHTIPMNGGGDAKIAKNKKVKHRLKTEEGGQNSSKLHKLNKKQKLLSTSSSTTTTTTTTANNDNDLNLNESSSTIKSLSVNLYSCEDNTNDECLLPVTVPVPLAQPLSIQQQQRSDEQYKMHEMATATLTAHSVENFIDKSRIKSEESNENIGGVGGADAGAVAASAAIEIQSEPKNEVIKQEEDLDKSKEAAALLLADLSIRQQIQPGTDSQPINATTTSPLPKQTDTAISHSIDETIIQVVNSSAHYGDDSGDGHKSHNHATSVDCHNSGGCFSTQAITVLTSATTVAVHKEDSELIKAKKFKKIVNTENIKSKKRKSCESTDTEQQQQQQQQQQLPSSLTAINKSPKSQKPQSTNTKRRKHINEMDATATTPTPSMSIMTATSIAQTPTPTQLIATQHHPLPYLHQQQQHHDIVVGSLDIFGNRLNTNAHLPPGITNDFCLEDITKSQGATTHQQQHKVSQINTILNKKAPIVCPQTPVINKYTILEESHEANEPATSLSSQQFPETLEELLLKKWQLGAEFIMEQSEHFDITSLLNCLYQLKKENKDLDTKALELTKKRDQLMLINSRLTLPLEIRSSLSSNEMQTNLFLNDNTNPNTGVNSNNENSTQQKILQTSTTTSNNSSLSNTNNKSLTINTSCLQMGQSQQAQQHQQRNGLSSIFDTNKIIQNDETLYKQAASNLLLNKLPQSHQHQHHITDPYDKYTPQQQQQQHPSASTTPATTATAASSSPSSSSLNVQHSKLNKIKQSKKQNDYLNAHAAHAATAVTSSNQYNNPHQQQQSSKPTNLQLNEYLASNVNDILLSHQNAKFSQDYASAIAAAAAAAAQSQSQSQPNAQQSILNGTPILINTLTNNIPKIIDSTKNISGLLNASAAAAHAAAASQQHHMQHQHHHHQQQQQQQQRPASVAAINTAATAPQAQQQQQQQQTQNTEIRKFEKINQLLSLQQPNECSIQKPSAYVTPVMIKHQQQQLQLPAMSGGSERGIYNNSKSFYQHETQISTLNTQPISPPLPQMPGNSHLTTSTSSLTTATNTTVPQMSSGTSTSTSTTSNTTNEMYYPSQNILLTPSLTLNYGWQNLLQHVDPTSASSLLSLVPHFSNIDLLSLQHHHQKQQQLAELNNSAQQQQQQQQQQGNVNKTTNSN